MKNVPINGVDDKRRITATFAVSSTGTFLPIQLIYSGKHHVVCQSMISRACFPLVLPRTIGQTQKSIEFFEEIIFPYLRKVRKEKGFPEEQHSLVIMDTFKGQDNDTFCSENCEIVIVPQSH